MYKSFSYLKVSLHDAYMSFGVKGLRN